MINKISIINTNRTNYFQGNNSLTDFARKSAEPKTELRNKISNSIINTSLAGMLVGAISLTGTKKTFLIRVLIGLGIGALSAAMFIKPLFNYFDNNINVTKK